ncbi:MAG: hypothetical protein GX383_07545 [Clostridium sp.]|jgi:hypothetical protein|nr:hypothetical protein [Clostridium sp.]
MELYKEVKKVGSKEEFLKFLELLITDFKNNPDEWENKNVESFLEGIQSWVDDMEGYYENNNLATPNNIDWGFFANVFYAGKIYE